MISQIENELAPLRKQLVNHDLYKNLKSITDIKIFMEQHVFAVWDFMSLVKKLQIDLTNTKIPWTPSSYPIAGRLINEIVWGEETDINKNNTPMSHFEMYIDSMLSIDANTKLIDDFINDINNGSVVEDALKPLNIPREVKEFVNFSFTIIKQNKTHEIAAVFTFGREDLLPSLFIKLLEQLQKKEDSNLLDDIIYYFKRHIELDGDEHGPMALNMISELCGNDKLKWNEAMLASKKALQMRINLWNSINRSIKKNYKFAS